MKKAQRKAHVRAVKAQQKAARKAAREQAAEQLEGAIPAAAKQTQEAPVQDEIFDRQAQCVSSTFTLAKLEVSDAKIEAMFLSDDRAREILSQAAETIQQVIDMASRALRRVDPDVLAEAIQVAEEPPTRDELGKVTQRPRRGTNPVITLVQVLMRAKNLLMRILAITNPVLVGEAKAKAKAAAKAYAAAA